MAALAKEQFVGENTSNIGSPKMGAVKIFKGGMVGIVPSTGYARPFATGDFFAGHALETVDNSAGAAGALRVPVMRGTYYATVPVFSSTTVAHIGDPVWTSSDNHADLTRTDPGTTLTTTDLVGYISDVDNDGNVIIRFQTRQN